MNEQNDYTKLKFKDQHYIAYNKVNFKQNNEVGIIFLHGLKSDMHGTKGLALREYCKTKDYSYLQFDFRGHGASSGKFTDFNISDWIEDASFVLDNLGLKKNIIVGSSMGAWVGLKLAEQRKDKVNALITIAPAPDFTEYAVWDKLSEQDKEKLTKEGIIEFASDSPCNDPYLFTYDLILDGRKNLLLNKDRIDITCPVTILHGMRDEDIHYDIAINLTQKLVSEDVRVILHKESGHGMSKPKDLADLYYSVDEMVAALK